MLVVVIGVFLATELPLMVITALHTLSSRLHTSSNFATSATITTSTNHHHHAISTSTPSIYPFMDYEVANTMVLVINTIICLSYPLNFAIYCGMSRQFRDTCRALVPWHRVSLAQTGFIFLFLFIFFNCSFFISSLFHFSVG